MNTSPSILKDIVCTLTDKIGVRLAGSPQEKQAADYLAETLGKYASKVVIEEFPVNERCVSSERLEIFIGDQWKTFPASLFSSAPGTDGLDREAEIVFFDTATGYQRPDLSFMHGKAVVHLGCHIETEDNYRRLMEAGPAFILFVDVRYPADYALADGLFPSYVRKYGAVPSMNVAFKDAWSWKTANASRARINVTSSILPSTTSVVVAEIPGTCPESGVIYAGGHHDTQANTVGADDNAIGSAAVCELARLLAQTPHRRTIRLISFGAEEQLSVGSSSYVRAHRREIAENGLFMCNFDSFGSALGWGEFTVNASDALRQLIKKTFNDKGIFFVESTDPCPYTDQFPFAADGVPGIWLSRANCTTGMFYHHRIDNTPDKIDFDISATYVDAAASLIQILADTEDITPFATIPENQKSLIDDLFKAVYGGF